MYYGNLMSTYVSSLVWLASRSEKPVKRATYGLRAIVCWSLF